MKETWFKRNFGWIADDFRRLVALLRQREMWILLAIMGLFATLVYFFVVLTLNMDFTMRLRNLTAAACSEVGNSGTVFLFYGMVFFGLTISMVFGEFARHLDYKRRKAMAQARSAAYHCAGWLAFALLLGLAVIVFLNSLCG